MRRFCFLLLGIMPGWFAAPLPALSQPRSHEKPGPDRLRPATKYVPNRYIVFLREPPVASRYLRRQEMDSAAARHYRAQIQAGQRNLANELAARNIRVTGAVDTLLNAVFVVASPERVAELRSLPGVMGVMPERALRKNLNKATQVVNAPAAWGNAAIGGASNAGSWIKIAILDTGIDQNHPAFQDASLTVPPGFPKCNAPSDCASFTNNKVIVARSYVPQIAAQAACAQPSLAGCALPVNPVANPATSSPDDYSARDRDGHGTAVAAAAAGNQNSAGSFAFSGMAPKAYLGNYKIWGSPGVNDISSESVWIQALEDAFQDGMDIANMSSGTPAFTGALDTTACGNLAGVPCDPLAAAFEAAARAGMVITVAAGSAGVDAYNSGGYHPNFNSISSPATAPSVIAVGATLNAHALAGLVSVQAANAPSSLKAIAAQRGDSWFGVDPLTWQCCDSPALAASLVDVTTLGNDGLACSALPTGSLTGKMALIQQGGGSACTLDVKTMNAQNAGAVGVILYMARGGAPSIPEGVNILGPAVMISLADGQALKAYIDANPGTSVLIDTAGRELTLNSYNQLAAYSSFGPTPDGMIKPDLVAPGGYDSNLGSADNSDQYLPAPNGMYVATQSYDPNGFGYSATGYTAMDGTSLSAALVAGAAALVKQSHPGWTPGQIKSALLDYAAQDVATDDFNDPVDVEWLGAGRLDANAAVNATVTAEPATLSFGYLKAGAALPGPIPVTVTNLGSAQVTLAVAVAPGVAANRAAVRVDQSSITLAAGAHTTLNISLTGAVPNPGSYNGAVTLTSSAAGVAMRIPYMFLVSDGIPFNAVPVFGCCYGAVGSDLGVVPIRVTDQYGVPVAGAQVAWTASPQGAVTLRTASGSPGSVGYVPYAPAACSPDSGSAAVTCQTDSYGMAWVDVVGGTAATSQATICATVGAYSCAGGSGVQFDVTLIPVPGISAGGVVDFASGQPVVVPGSYANIWGTNLMDPNWLVNSSGDYSTYARVPMTLDGVTVSFDAPPSGSLPAISVPGYMGFVSPGEVSLYVPWELENYPAAQVKVTFDEALYSNLVNVALSNYGPAFLLSNGSVAEAWDSTGALISSSNPTTCGQTIQLRAIGLGPVTNQPASGDPAPASPLPRTTSPVTVTIGGQSAQVAGGMASLVPGSIGLYQVNVQVPPGMGAGNQPIAISVGGQTSPATSGGSPVTLPMKSCAIPLLTLTVTKSGAGSGTVTSSPAGINCGTACSAQFASGTPVTLTAAAASGSSFGGWSGACSGTGTCAVTMNVDQNVTAAFSAAGTAPQLSGAFNFPGPYPTPGPVNYTDPSGRPLTSDAYAGQVFISVATEKISPASATTLIQANHGSIIAQIPGAGLYWVQVPAGTEAAFIAAVRANSAVILAAPNVALIGAQASPVDLRGSTSLTPLFLTGVLAQFDQFIGTDVCGMSHGSAVGRILGLSGQSPNQFQAASDSDLAFGLERAAEGALEHGQKLVLNVSLQAGSAPNDGQDRGVCETNPAASICSTVLTGNTGVAGTGNYAAWKADELQFLLTFANALHNMPQNLRDNTLVVVAAGNSGLDLTHEIGLIRTYLPNAVPHMIIVGATGAGAQPFLGFNHSNDAAMLYAPGLDVTIPGTGGCAKNGTSLAAPQVASLAAQVAVQFPNLTTAQIVQDIMRAAPIVNGLPALPTLSQVVAVIQPPNPQTLTVGLAGTGGGGVASSPPGISCPGVCSASFPNGTTLTLNAAPNANSTFVGWSGGGCAGTGACVVVMNMTRQVTATFNPAGGSQTWLLDFGPEPAGKGEALAKVIVIFGNGALTGTFTEAADSQSPGVFVWDGGLICSYRLPIGGSISHSVTGDNWTFSGVSAPGCGMSTVLSGGGTANGMFPNATSVTGTVTFSTQSPLGTQTASGSWIGTRQ